MSMRLISSSGASSACLLPERSFPDGRGLPASSWPPGILLLTMSGISLPVSRHTFQASHRNIQASCPLTSGSQQAQLPALQFVVAPSWYKQRSAATRELQKGDNRDNWLIPTLMRKNLQGILEKKRNAPRPISLVSLSMVAWSEAHGWGQGFKDWRTLFFN